MAVSEKPSSKNMVMVSFNSFCDEIPVRFPLAHAFFALVTLFAKQKPVDFSNLSKFIKI